MSNWSERARQMMADIPEVAIEFRTAIHEHNAALIGGTDQIAIRTTWKRVMESAARFVRTNTEISKLLIEYYEHPGIEK